MTRWFPALTIGLLVTTAALQAQQRDAPPPVPPSGRLSGSVVNAESGRPIRFARVVLEGPNGVADELTAEDGSFAFERLRPGRYRLRVTRAGYLEAAWGQTRPGTATPGKPIDLADREQRERLVVPLSQGGSISGVVRDERGEPLFRASVRVGRWVMRNGVRMIDGVDAVSTDERGRYRVSLLPSRDYVVSATPGDDAIPDTKRRPASQAFAPAFYPGVVSARAATLVSLAPGEERADVDIQLPLVQLGRVTGVVVGMDGRPVPGMSVALSERDLDNQEQGTETDSLGRFAFEKVAPGNYTVTAGRVGHAVHIARKFTVKGDSAEIVLERDFRKIRNALSAMQTGDWVIADAGESAGLSPVGSAAGEVTVASSNTSDITLTLDAPRTVAGRLVTEGSGTPPSFRGAVVSLTARSLAGEEFSAKVAADGTFTIPNVLPGRYVVSFAGEAPPWTLAAAMSNGVDALDFFLDVPRDRDVRDLVLTMRDRSGELAGSVADGEGKPATGRIAIVFPSDERLWVAGEYRIKAVPLGDDGKFVFEGMRPGSYLLAISDGLEEDEWLNQDVLRRLVSAAVPVTIAEGEKRVQDLRIR